MTSQTPQTRASGDRARWVATVALAALAGGLLFQLPAAGPVAVAQTASAGDGDVFVCAGQITTNSYGLYLVDIEQRVICVYQWLPTSRKLRFMAARDFTHDLKLDDYNTEQHPRDIKKLAEQGTTPGD